MPPGGGQGSRPFCVQDARLQAQDAQARLQEDVALQQRLLTDLRTETTMAVQRESAAIAALDEQLWITDQRLGQRIDELGRRERPTSGARLALGRSEPPAEPISEAADLARRVSGGVSAAAQKITRSVMAEASPRLRSSETLRLGASRRGLHMASQAAEAFASHAYD